MALKDAMENLEAERDKIHLKSKEAHAAMLEKEVQIGEKLRHELSSIRESSESKEKQLNDEVMFISLEKETGWKKEIV